MISEILNAQKRVGVFSLFFVVFVLSNLTFFSKNFCNIEASQFHENEKTDMINQRVLIVEQNLDNLKTDSNSKDLKLHEDFDGENIKEKSFQRDREDQDGGNTVDKFSERQDVENSLSSLKTLADIVDPLLPTVVNIYSEKYDKYHNYRDNLINNFFQFDFGNVNNKFEVPFFYNEVYFNSRATSLGSGFIIDPTGFIVTNYHVVSNADEISVKLFDDSEFRAKIIGTDPRTDIALLKIDREEKLPYVTFGDSSKIRVGDFVFAIGNPLGFGGTVTKGIISSKGRQIELNNGDVADGVIQTDAAFNVGNSGGPLFDINGKVIGVNTAIPAVGDGKNIGIGFAIPSNTVNNVVQQLKNTGKVERGRLNISIQNINKRLAAALGLDKAHGTIVVAVKPGGAGEEAGLRVGDIIVELNGQKVANAHELQSLVALSEVNTDVKLKIIRGNNTITLDSKITESSEKVNFDKIDDSKNLVGMNVLQHIGIILGELSKNSIDKFKLHSDSKGVVVLRVQWNSSRETGLRAGDLILGVLDDSNSISYIGTIEELDNLYKLALSKKKEYIVLVVQRGGLITFMPIIVK